MRAHVGTGRQFDPLAVADRSVFWISMQFGVFGLFARAIATAIVALLIGAISGSTAIFLILKLNHPYLGLMRISGAPLHNAPAQIGQ
ncbi:MAG: hypothetical protein WA231_14030 [Methylocella sp.]